MIQGQQLWNDGVDGQVAFTAAWFFNKIIKFEAWDCDLSTLYRTKFRYFIQYTSDTTSWIYNWFIWTIKYVNCILYTFLRLLTEIEILIVFVINLCLHVLELQRSHEHILGFYTTLG